MVWLKNHTHNRDKFSEEIVEKTAKLKMIIRMTVTVTILMKLCKVLCQIWWGMVMVIADGVAVGELIVHKFG